MKVAFYPCCACDFEMPASILTNYVDKIIFCDVKRSYANRLARESRQIKEKYNLVTEMIIGDARDVVKTLPQISVLFYKRDSMGGEGGSGVEVLGNDFLRDLMQKFPDEGGLLLTDGSNSGKNNFSRMISDDGLIKFDKKFSKSEAQPYLEELNLWKIQVGNSDV